MLCHWRAHSRTLCDDAKYDCGSRGGRAKNSSHEAQTCDASTSPCLDRHNLTTASIAIATLSKFRITERLARNYSYRPQPTNEYSHPNHTRTRDPD